MENPRVSLASTLRRNIFYPLWIFKNQDRRHKYLKRYEQLQYLSEKELKVRQFRYLKKILLHSYQNTTYYKQLFNQAKFDPEKFDNFSQMKQLPILTKEQIQTNSDQLIAENYNKHSLVKFKTGGSTGKALTIYSNRDRLERGVAAADMCFKWSGWNIGEPMARIWGNPDISKVVKQKLKNYFLQPVIWLDTMHLNRSSMFEFVERWKKTKPTLLHGHAHSLFIFANFLMKEKIFELKPKGIIATSMMLLPSERALVEDVFGVKVIDLYGCEEVGLIACECPWHEGMHLNVINAFIEFIKEDGSIAEPGEEGAIVVSSLTNYAMPLIRYRIEDIGIPSDRRCSCQRGLPLIEKVTGRIADFLIKRDGSLVAGISLIERTLTKIPGLSQMQIVQENMEDFQINLVKNEDYSEKSRFELLKELKNVFSDRINIHIEFVNKIKQEKSGKYRFSICKLRS